jgi:hypothetical protein
MKRMFRMALLLLGSMFTLDATARAEDAAGNYYAYGHGLQSCGGFGQARRQPNGETRTWRSKIRNPIIEHQPSRSRCSYQPRERYDRVLEDIFTVQEEVTQAIVAAIAPQIASTEESKATRRRPGNLSAYEIALRAWAHAGEGWDKADRTLRNQRPSSRLPSGARST